MPIVRTPGDSSKWTPEVDDFVIEHYCQAKVSIREIAGMLTQETGTPFTKNMVIGRIARLREAGKLTYRVAIPKPKQVRVRWPKPEPAPEPAVTTATLEAEEVMPKPAAAPQPIEAAFAASLPVEPVPEPREPESPVTKRGVHLLKVGFGQCRWIVGHSTKDGLAYFCGEKTHNAASSWCSAHLKLIMAPPQPYRRKGKAAGSRSAA